MKKILWISALFIAGAANAQKLTLTKGQQITISSTIVQDIDMSSMGMQMKNNTSTTGIIMVNDTDKDHYQASYKVSKMKIAMEVMGQETKFDSENPEDSNTDMGKELAGKINQSVNVSIDKITGKAVMEEMETALKKEDDGKNPMEEMMNSFGPADDAAAVETAYLIIPLGKKKGDSWMDSTSKEGMKNLKTFTIKEIKDNVAIIGINELLKGSTSTEAQGMQMEITIDSKTTGDIFVNTKTALVKKRVSTMELSGTIDMMGQTIPMSSKATMTVDYN